MRRYLLFTLTALLGACTLAPVSGDAPLRLAGGHGVAALMIDTFDPLTEVTVRSHGVTLQVPTVPPGVNLYLFQAPAGSYCLMGFHYGRWNMTGPKRGLGCFEVAAGRLNYSGTFAPRVENGKPVTRQVQDLAGFRALLQERYPAVAAEFPP